MERALQTVDCRPSTVCNTICHLHVSQETIKENSQAVPSTGMGLMQKQGRTNPHPHPHRRLHLAEPRTGLEVELNMTKGTG